MATPLPITVVIAPLPDDFEGTPQEIADAIAERLSFETQESLALFGIGDVLPVSDEGPFLLNGTTWYVWDEGAGQYVPQTIEFQADINPKPWRGTQTADHVITLPGTGSAEVEIDFTEVYDTDGCFETSTFVAPDDGFYSIKAKVSIAATDGSPTDNIFLMYLKKNGFQMPNEQVFAELGNVFLGRTLQISTDIRLNAGDTIKLAVSVSCTNGGEFTVFQGDGFLCGHKIRNTTF